jgi:hypothetical protein
MSASSVLSSNNLDFLSGSTLYAKLAATDSVVTFSSTSGDVELQGIKAPTDPSSATNKAYVDALVEGLNWKDACRVASTGYVDIATELEDGDFIDGVELATGDRVLLKNQQEGVGGGVQNGIYVVVASGAASRAADLANGDSARGAAVFAEEGTVCAGCAFVCTNDAGSDTVGTDPLTFTPISAPLSYVGGDGIDITGNVIAVDNTVLRTTGAQSITGQKTFTADGVKLNDNAALIVGTDNDLTLTHDGTNTTMTSTGGNFITINNNATGSTINRLGSSDALTSFQVQNDGSTPLLSVNGLGQADISSRLKVGPNDFILSQGPGGSVVQSDTNLVLDLTSSSTNVEVVLGLPGDTTSFLVKDTNTDPLLEVHDGGSVSTASDVVLGIAAAGGRSLESLISETITGAGTGSLTAQQMKNGIILRDPDGANRTDTTASATDIVNSIVDAVDGTTYNFFMKNIDAGSLAVTLQPGTGVTFDVPIVIQAGEVKSMLVRITNATTPAVTIFTLSTPDTNPCGSDTQVQFNNAGEFGGITGVVTTDGNELTVTDGTNLNFGTNNNMFIEHAGDGSDGQIRNNTGNLLVVCTEASSNISLGFQSGTGAHFYDDNLETTLFGNLNVQGDTVRKLTVTPVTQNTGRIYTADEIKGGIILRNPVDANVTDTTATAAQIVASITDCIIGSSFAFDVSNDAPGNFTVTLNGGTDVSTVGTFTLQQNEIRRFQVLVTDDGSVVQPEVTIYALTSNGEGSATPPGGSDTQMQFNNAGVFDGAAGVTTNGTNLSLANNSFLNIGAGDNLTLTHNTTNSVITSMTGNLIIDNTNATGTTVVRLGTDDADTDFQVQGDGGASLFTVDGSSAATLAGVTTITDATQSTTSTDGCLVLAGGVGVAKDIRCGGNAYALTHTSTSDINMKTCVVDVGNVDPVVRNLRVAEYSWKNGPDTQRRKVGLIAQEVVKLAPGAVYESEGGMSVDYHHLMCMMMKSHQQALSTIDDLSARLAVLEK